VSFTNLKQTLICEPTRNTGLPGCGVDLCAGVTCTALDQCHDVGVCDPQTGLCSNPVKANGTACNDTDLCTQTDTCQAGVCTGSNPVTCTALDQCHDVGVCNSGTGLCSNPPKANGTPCDDGQLCTYNDVCASGTCGGTAIVCTDDQCNTKTCNGTASCTVTPKTNGTSCDDGNVCTTPDTCTAGVCGGPAVPAPPELNNSVLLNGGGGGGGATTISWTDAPGPYNVYRGLLAGSWSYNHTCFDPDIPGPSADSAVPSTGQMYYYLVSRRDNVCSLESVLGRGPGGAADPNPSPCP
jgi:hypothetical protein